MSGLFARVADKFCVANDKVADSLTQQLRAHAVESGWDKDLTSHLFITYADKQDRQGPKGWRIEIAQAADGVYEKIRDEEYGFGAGSEPNPVMRRIVNRLPRMVAATSAEYLRGRL